MSKSKPNSDNIEKYCDNVWLGCAGFKDHKCKLNWHHLGMCVCRFCGDFNIGRY